MIKRLRHVFSREFCEIFQDNVFYRTRPVQKFRKSIQKLIFLHTLHKKWSFPLRIWSHLMKKSLMGNFIFLVILLPKEESFFNPIQVGPFRGWSRMGGGGVGGGGVWGCIPLRWNISLGGNKLFAACYHNAGRKKLFTTINLSSNH